MVNRGTSIEAIDLWCYQGEKGTGDVHKKSSVKIMRDKIKNLSSNQKLLLYALRANNWEVISMENQFSDWYLDKIWIIESQKESWGFKMELEFHRHDGLYDGMDTVVTIQEEADDSKSYGAELNFKARKFEVQLKSFINFLHKKRVSH